MNTFTHPDTTPTYGSLASERLDRLNSYSVIKEFFYQRLGSGECMDIVSKNRDSSQGSLSTEFFFSETAATILIKFQCSVDTSA
jgi:hypothetical protein